MALGFRIVAELVSAIAVGIAIGWGLDRWLGTTPLLLVVFLILGFTAGLLNVYRAAQEAERHRDATPERKE